MFYMLKTKKYILHTFQNITPSREKQVFLLFIPNGEKCEAKSKGRSHFLTVKNYRHYEEE